ncbi:MAG: Hpt domain-containing protein, partial [Microcystaceae cyanobacterium]
AYQFFIEEAPELLHIIEDGLLTLRSQRTQGAVHEIMRAAHSLKGGAASVQLPAIKDIAHRLEDIFKAFYNESVVIDEDMESLLLQAYDCLKDPLLIQIEGGTFDDEAAIRKSEPVFEAIEFLLGDNLAAGEQYLPSSADLGVDIVSSLFEVDIVQGVEQIKAALASGNDQQILETLTIQTEVFAGLAELLNLPGFKAITDAVQTSLQSHPDQINQIAALAVTDWQGSCDRVLKNSDRSQGGTPSPELLALSGWSEIVTPGMNGFSEPIANGFAPLDDPFALTGEVLPDFGDVFADFSEPVSPIANDFTDVFSDFGAVTAPLGDVFSDFGTMGDPLEDAFAAISEQSQPENLSVDLPLQEGLDGLDELNSYGANVPKPERKIAEAEDVNIYEPSYQFFVEEAPELLQLIEEGLLTLKGDRSAAKVHEIMRAAHSLKGGAASVGLTAIKEISHRLEEIFKAFYSDSLVLDENLESLLLQAYDCLKLPLEQQITTGSYDPQSALDEAVPLLDAIAEVLGDYLSLGEQFLPSSADLGVDIVSSIFEVDITQGLKQLQEAVNLQDLGEITAVLTIQTEVFLGLAEILNLSGFKGIAEAVSQAMQTNPDQINAIAQQALLDWQNSCEQVLQNGDRKLGGSPSEALLALTRKSESEKVPLQIETTPKLSISDLFGGDDEEEASVVEEPEISYEWVPPVMPVPLETVEQAQVPVVAETENVFSSFLSDVSENEVIQIPDLADVFGGLIPDAVNWEEQGLTGLATPTTPSLDDAGLAAMVQSVEQVFEQLPEAKNASVPSPLKKAKAKLETPPIVPKSPDKNPPGQAAPPANLSIRVDFQRLERMNNWVGELAINRNSLSLQNEQLQSSVRSLLSRFSQFQNMTNKLRLLADQLVIMPDAEGHLRIRAGRTDWTANTFDSLEMDSYGALSGQLQEILEEMMQLEEKVDDIVLFARATNQSLEEQRQMLFSLRDELMWARMLPLGEVLNRFPRLLRDLSTKYHKPVQLKLQGTAVLVDRLALEKLYDPLMHLLRNAFDHGIEKPEVRARQGKPEMGTIEIQAFHQGNQTIIELRDDGGGLKTDRILQQGIEKGLITEEQSKRMTPEQIHNLIFEPNFSTASQVSELSGRGVGLDVVRQQLQSLKGNVSVSSRADKGTTFSLRLPLTLTIAKLLVCLINPDNQAVSGGSTTLIAIPSDSVAELMVPRNDQIKIAAGQRFLIWQGQTIAIYPLNTLLPYNCALPERQTSKVLASVPHPEDWNLPVILLKRGNHYYALEVSRLVT